MAVCTSLSSNGFTAYPYRLGRPLPARVLLRRRARSRNTSRNPARSGCGPPPRSRPCDHGAIRMPSARCRAASGRTRSTASSGRSHHVNHVVAKRTEQLSQTDGDELLVLDNEDASYKSWASVEDMDIRYEAPLPRSVWICRRPCSCCTSPFTTVNPKPLASLIAKPAGSKTPSSATTSKARSPAKESVTSMRPRWSFGKACRRRCDTSSTTIEATR